MKPFLTLIFQVIFGLLLPVYSFAQTDACGSAPTLISAPSCVNTAGSLPGAATYTVIPALGCGTANDDVWYTFVAKATNPTITLSSNTVSNVRLQLFSGSCAGLTSVACGTTSIAATGLTIGNTYLIRIYSTTNASGTFNICITDPAPANNLCTGAITLTSATSCANTTGNVYASTNSAPTISVPNCASSVIYDVWYRFVAQTTNPTISLSSIGSSFTNPALQLLSNNCGGTFVSYYCGTTSIAADFLTPGTTYYIRVYSSSGTAPTGPTNAGFDICITDPVSTAPFNDECANAVNLPIWNTCNNIGGNMAGATASAIPLGGSCTGPLAYDVWYRFTAINTTATITLSSIGANFLTPRIEMFSGTCGALTSIFCGASPLAATGLTAGVTYYIRVYSRTAPPPNGNARFNICATTTNAPVRFGNSYVNITRKTTGGVVQPGDTLEIRMTVNHTSGTMYGLRYVDNKPSNTGMLTGTNDSIRVITNEGLTFRKYTLGAADDAATYNASPPAGEYNIRVNLGFGSSSPGIPVNNTSTESASATGTMIAGSDRPRGGGGMLFAVAYRVVVTGIAGDTINLSPGQFIYKTSAGGSDISLTASTFKILISDPLALCTNSIGVNIAEEFSGTFGSGAILNRSTDLTTPINGYTFVSDVSAYSGVGDGRYAIVKNLSPRSGIIRSARRRNTCNVPTALPFDDNYNCNKRMFDGFWFIDGDHTGTNDATGNNPPAAADSSGYMLMVNADYVASEVYRQNITNLCPNTYYEFSAWVRNICPTCGIDSTGAQFAGTPTAPTNGYPGVYPNLSFSLNDVDYYNTGEIDTLGWLKKGFVFKTGPSQTTATFSIRNNSQGGGGNDWAVDDIGIQTCAPDITVTPGPNPFVCDENTVDIGAIVTSFFDNYVYYQWEESTDNGATWTPTGPVGGPATPAWNGSAWEYSVTYPTFVAQVSDSGKQYRVVTASTPTNIADVDCRFSDAATITLTVDDCSDVLETDIISFSGKNVNNEAVLNWITTRENNLVKFDVQRSHDGITFTTIAYLNGHNNVTKETNQYTYTDQDPLKSFTWYRIKMTNQLNNKYSTIVKLVDENTGLSIQSLVNPFSSAIKFDAVSGYAGVLQVELLDQFKRKICSEVYTIQKGVNSIILGDTDKIPSGVYILRLNTGNTVLQRKVIKRQN